MDVFYGVEEPGTVLFSLQTDTVLTGKNVLIRLSCFFLTGLFTPERMQSANLLVVRRQYCRQLTKKKIGALLYNLHLSAFLKVFFSSWPNVFHQNTTDYCREGLHIGLMMSAKHQWGRA